MNFDTVKIKAKTSFAGIGFSAVNGQVIDLPVYTAMDLIRAGFAEIASDDATREEVKNENKRDNASVNIKPVKRKRVSVKRD